MEETPYMDAEQWMKLFSLITTFVQVIAWPLIVLIVAIYLRKPVRKFIGEITEVNLKAGPVETTARSKQALEIAASLGAATAQIQENSDLIHPAEIQSEIPQLVDQAIASQNLKHLQGISILWVDDQPLNNSYARHALESLGVRFAIATSTHDAIEELSRATYDAIISDMGRPPDPRAGYTLLAKVRDMKFAMPYIIYSKGANKPEHKAEALQRGAYASASGPQDLFRTIVTLFTKPATDATTEPAQNPASTLQSTETLTIQSSGTTP